jgi:outer membrane murein-binding lipoprotein Lpp
MAPDWVPLVGVSITGTVAIVGGIVFAMRVSWRLGQAHEQHQSLTKRVESLEKDAKEGEDHRSAVKLLNQALAALQQEMREVKQTLQTFIENAARPRRRAQGD